MKKIVMALAALFVAFGIISCTNPSNLEDEKKINQSELKIYVPADGVDISETYEYIFSVWENGVGKVDAKGNNIEYHLKPGSMLHLEANNNTIFSVICGIISESGDNYGFSIDSFYVKKGEAIKANISLTDNSTPQKKNYLVNIVSSKDSVLSFDPYMPDTPIGYNGTADRNYPYVEFGEWPQTLVGNINKVNTSISEVHGMFTYYRYDEDEWCVEAGGTYFLVEPIKWRILNKDEYAKTGKALLLAEKILTTLKYYDLPQNRQSGVYASNYEASRVRAFLNGLQYEGHYGEIIKDFNDGTNAIGFLQTAFTKKQISKILDTNVDNSELSTTDHNKTLQPATGYTCNNTLDKIFLLSFNEASNEDYGFGVFNDTDSKRKRVYTGYATQIQQGLTGNPVYIGPGEWMLRSPYASYIKAHYVETDGSSNASSNVVAAPLGCVPALWVEL